MMKIYFSPQAARFKALAVLLGLLSLPAAMTAEGREPPRPMFLETPATFSATSTLEEGRLNRAALSLLRGRASQENLDYWPAELRGWAWLQGGEYGRALAAWGEVTARGEPVAGWLKLAQSRALLQAGAEADHIWNLTRPILESPTGAKLIKSRARLLTAEARLQKKQYRETLAFIKTWPPAERKSSPACRMSGAAREGLGQWEAALADYKAAWEKSLPNRERVLAAAEYRRLLKITANRHGGRFWLELVNLHRREWRLEEALHLIAKAPTATLSAAQKNELAAQKKLLAIYQGRYEEGCAYYLGSDAPQRRRRYGRCLERAERYQEGAQVFEALAKSGADKDEDTLNAVRLRALGGEFAKAAQLAKTLTKARYQAEASWHQGLALALNGRWAESRPFFAEPAQSKQAGLPLELVQGGRYFWARALEESHSRADQLQARRLFRELADGSPGYYKILAGGRCYGPGQPYAAAALAALMDVEPGGHDSQSLAFHLWFRSLDPLIPAEAEALAEEFLADDSPPANFKALIELLTAGLWPQALEEADYLLVNDRRRLSAAQQARLARLVWALSAQSGRYHQALRSRNILVNLMPRKQRLEQGPSLNLSGHPLVFSRPVLDAYRRYGLPPQLLMALIKTESAWQDEVVSAANAQGLMQLLPATAERIARNLGEPIPDEARLGLPELNIRYGSWYLAALTEGFEGQWPLALAGYNGGPFNIARWVKRHPQADLDVFLETIPLEETRRYVKKVIEGMYLYESAYLGRGGFVDLAHPTAQPNDRLPLF